MNARPPSAGSRLRVFVASGHPVIEMGWSAMLARDGGFELVGSATSGGRAIGSISGSVACIDLVLVDSELPDMPGADLVRTLLPLHPPLRFALLTGRSVAAVPHDAMAIAPRVCHVQHEASVAELTQALRSLRPQRVRFGGSLGATEGSGDGLDGNGNGNGNGNGLGGNLTQRERELLALMGLGLSNQQISERLNIAMPTVKFHVTHILSKMGADNRTEAVLLGLRHGLVQLHLTEAPRVRVGVPVG